MTARPLPTADPTSGRSLAQRAGLVVGPALAAVLLLADWLGWQLDADRTKLNAMAAVAVLMAVWWLTEAVPLAVTAMLPLVLFPLLHIPPYSEVAREYGREVLFLYLGGFLIALGIEESGLHRRVALFVLSLVGDRPRQIVLGFMLATGVLSMWISNTATTLMMLPIAVSVLVQAEKGVEARRVRKGPNVDQEARRRFAVGLLLAVAYSASIGGIATLIGTPTNLVLVHYYPMYADGASISFTSWMAVALPFSAVMMLLAWLFLTRVMFPIGNERLLGGRNVIRDELHALGPMTAAELRMAIIFAATAVLWITREPVQGVGWGPLIGPLIDGERSGLVKDSTVAIFMATFCFIVPRGGKDRRTLVTWDMTTRVPWGIILLFGGGFALGKGLQETGLDSYLGDALARQMDGMPTVGMIVLIAGGMTFLTELTSNTASAAMLLPILGGAAGQLDVPPWDLMVPATIASSCAFMLPVATPPNAIVYSAGRVQMRDMIRAGFWLNLIGIVLVVVWMGVV